MSPRRDREAVASFSLDSGSYAPLIIGGPRWPSVKVSYANALCLLLGIAFVLDLLHETFHFADWLTWGAGLERLWPFSPEVRDLLYGFYGAHNLIGYVAHALTGGLRLSALGAGFLYLLRRRHAR